MHASRRGRLERPADDSSGTRSVERHVSQGPLPARPRAQTVPTGIVLAHARGLSSVQ